MAFDALKHERCAVLNAPTGWGKTLVMVMLILWKLRRNPNLRCIIAVPQTVIGSGYVRDWLLRIPGHRRPVKWSVTDDLCSHRPRKVEQLLSFLSSSAARGHVLLCTHATLAAAHARLRDVGRLSLLKNVILWIDETHHVRNAERVDGEVLSNSLGEIVDYCVNAGGHVGLATATYSRGDRRHILNDELAAKFKRHSVPYDTYFEEHAPIKGFSFTILCEQYEKALKHICCDHKPSIIYLPKRNSYSATDCKYTEVKRIVAGLAKTFKAKVRREGDLILLAAKDRTYRVLDLVTEEGRERRKAYLHGVKSPRDLDIILSLNMCREGFDWIWAERCVIIGERRSLTELLQTVGRLFRKAPGKNTAEVFQVLTPVVGNAAALKENRNEIMSAAFGAMLLEDFLKPIPISNKRGEAARITEVIPNLGHWQEIVREFLIAAQGRTFEESLACAKRLGKYGIKASEQHAVWRMLWKRFAYRAVKVGKAPRFDILKSVDVGRGVLAIATDLCGIKTFAQLRRVLCGDRNTLEQWVVTAEELAKRQGGILPPVIWLQRNGLQALVAAMWAYPQMFAHIRQRSLHKTLEQHVTDANAIVAEHGCIPSDTWLRENGYIALRAAMRNHPDAFRHIRIGKKLHGSPSLPHHISAAEKLVAKHGGLPNPGWLKANGHGALLSAIRKHPDAFAHLPRAMTDSDRRKAANVAKAETLVKKHGQLPSRLWLRSHGCSGIEVCINAYPELFKHIPRDWGKKAG